MEIIRTICEMQKMAEELRLAGQQIGLVPTMGFLHEGHLSLLDIAKKNSDVAIMSIYVNPTQFGPNEDLDKYPRDFKRDKKLAKQRGCDFIFYPDTKEIYPEFYQTFVSVEELTQTLCGSSRPIHFRGVTTVVAKLFNIIKPHVAVFGQKDAQQAIVIKQMVRDLNFDLEIIIGPIVRENDGLAMSSRNRYLSTRERKEALVLYNSLQKAQKMLENGIRDPIEIKTTMKKKINSVASSKIDYIEIVATSNLLSVKKIEGEILIAVAVQIGKTRLIDNLMVTV